MKMMSKRRMAAYVAIGVLLAGVVFGLSIPAAIQAGQRNAMDNMTWESEEAAIRELVLSSWHALDTTAPDPVQVNISGREPDGSLHVGIQAALKDRESLGRTTDAAEFIHALLEEQGYELATLWIDAQPDTQL